MTVHMGLGFLGTYINAAEIAGKEPTLTIDRVVLEKVESMKVGEDDANSKPKIKDRWIVYFRESKSGRGWLLVRTNAECLKAMWGDDVENWIGHKIVLFTKMVKVGPKMELGIRVKGSPDIPADITFDLKLPRKKPIPTTLVRTAKAAPAPSTPPPEQP